MSEWDVAASPKGQCEGRQGGCAEEGEMLKFIISTNIR